MVSGVFERPEDSDDVRRLGFLLFVEDFLRTGDVSGSVSEESVGVLSRTSSSRWFRVFDD